MENKILFISYNFPPAGGGGVQRPLKFVKYMHEFGYKPIVITVENPSSIAFSDKTLVAEIPENTTIIRAKTFEPSYSVKTVVMKKDKKRNLIEKIIRNIFIPDPQILWIPNLILKAFAAKKYSPDLIFVTAPPFSSLVAGVIIKFFLGKPLIVDFRDEWVGWLAGSSWTGIETTNKVRCLLESFMEKLVIKHSDAVITASPGYVDAFRERYKDSPLKSRFTCITNGYDPDDMKIENINEKYGYYFRNDKLNVIYMGTVWPATSLKYFLEGVSLMKNSNLIRLIVVGRITPDEEVELESFEGLDIVRIGYCTHKQAVSMASKADALLVTQSPVKGAERWIPGKIFEYMALSKHIIAILPDSSASDILGKHSGTIIVHPNDTDLIAKKSQELLEKWMDNKIEVINCDIAKEHTRLNKTKSLCTVFDKLLS